MHEREHTRAQKETGRGKEWGNGDAKRRETAARRRIAASRNRERKAKAKEKEKKAKRKKRKKEKGGKKTAGHLRSPDPFKVTVITEPTNHSRRIGICSRL
jgi:hypothetical protein